MNRRNWVILALFLTFIIVAAQLVSVGQWKEKALLNYPPAESKDAEVKDTLTTMASFMPFIPGTISRGNHSPVLGAGTSFATRKAAMIRLEDIGPGGNYSTLEDLGRLRAVVDNLYAQGVPFHVTVIPRFITANPDGTWRTAGIDDPSPSPETQAFISLLYYMESRGGVLGAHGYTHQYGEVIKPDGSHNSGAGNEFNEDGEAPSTTLTYARDRVELSIKAFQKLGIEPAFWETPHNVCTPEQRDVFRSAFGIQYESLNKKDLRTVYLEGENQFVSPTQGAVYVPTPLYYIEGGEKTPNSVEHILRRMMFFSGLAGFFYHPFLEYPFLEPVYNSDGTPVMVDGIPQYRYREGSGSHLQRMINGLRDWGYQFSSLHEVVPYTPGHRLRFSSEADSSWLTGDFNGDGRSEALVREENQLKVLVSRLQPPRWRTDTNLSVWMEVPEELKESPASVGDFNGDGLDDLVFYHSLNGQWWVALSDGSGFGTPRPWLAGWAKGPGWKIFIGDYNGDSYDDLLVMQESDQGWQMAVNDSREGFQPQPAHFSGLGEASWQQAVGDVNGDRTDDLIAYNTTTGTVQVAQVFDSRITAPQTWMTGGERFKQMVNGDFNGDSRCDLVFYSAREGVFYTASSNGRAMILQPHSFGPWAPGVKRLVGAGDFDGNGKTDLASLEGRDGYSVIDLAYSFQK